MTSTLIVWDGTYQVGPYMVGASLAGALLPSSVEEHYGVRWVDIDDEGITLILDGALLVGVTAWKEFWYDGINLIGSNAIDTCDRYFGGVAERHDALPFVEFTANYNGIEVLAEGEEIKRITVARFELVRNDDTPHAPTRS